MADLVIQQIENGSVYCRSMSAQSLSLIEILEKCYPCKQGSVKSIITPSGMAAISVTLTALLMEHKTEKINIIRGDELYCDTPRLTRYLSKSYDFVEHTFNVNDNKAIMDIFDKDGVNKQTNILFIESASNPSGDIFDYSIIPMLRKKSKRLYVIVDNTWLTHIIFNPFAYDADIVVTSLTKYYSAGKCIAGAIICKKKLHSKLFDYLRINGLHVSPLYCQFVIDSMASMEERLVKSSNITAKVANLMTNDKRLTIRHASISTDPSYQLALKFYKKIGDVVIYPSIISFTVPMKRDAAVEWMKSTNIRYETSYGSSYSKFDPWPEEYGDRTLCRLAIGFDDNDEQVWNKIKIN